MRALKFGLRGPSVSRFVEVELGSVVPRSYSLFCKKRTKRLLSARSLGLQAMSRRNDRRSFRVPIRDWCFHSPLAPRLGRSLPANRPMKLTAGGGRPQLIAGVSQTENRQCQ